MQVIPSVNAADFKTVRAQILAATEFSAWIHLDISDGIFTHTTTWAKPDELKETKNQISKTKNIEFEVHLMVANPELVAEAWLRSGAKRLIVHIEAMSNPPYLLDIAKETGGEIMLAAKPETPATRLLIYKQDFQKFQILAVPPGPAGQKFDERVLEKIKVLRAKASNAIIEVDGGINLETAKLSKAAGADIVVSANYVWKSPDPRKAYEELKNV